jgi:signal transduction histidine kinase
LPKERASLAGATDQDDEIGHLAAEINKMAQDLETTIDQQRQAEATVRQLNEELELRVQKRTAALQKSNEELDNFAYVASHDLKAPLRAIESLAQWIAEDAGEALPEESKKHLALMQQRVQRMEGLLDSLLQYSRVGRTEDEPEAIDTGELVRNLIEMQDPPESFTINVAPEMPTLHAPRGALNRVFGNLIGNALKHHDQEAGRIEISCNQNGDFYGFTVADDGPGIPEKFHDRVFEMFQTLKPRGLSIYQ